jgi:hypothetical protein
VFWGNNNRRINGDLSGDLSVVNSVESSQQFDPQVSSVNVSGPAEAVAGHAGAYQYTATVNYGYTGDGSGSTAVTWDVSGISDTVGTSYSASENTLDLTVGAAETEFLTVTASSVFDTTKADSKDVTVYPIGWTGRTTVGLYNSSGKIEEVVSDGDDILTPALTYLKTATAEPYFIVVGDGFDHIPIQLMVANDVFGPGTFTGPGVSNITLEGLSAASVISFTGTGILVNVNAGVTLTLGNNITLKGVSNNTATLVSVTNANLVMEEGSTITGNTNTSVGNSSAGVTVSANGRFTMNGGTISDNHKSGARMAIGAVYLSAATSSFEMTGGAITGNTATTTGAYNAVGGVYATGSFTMSDGAISGNSATSTNGVAGGVHVTAAGTFTMTGGTITGNTLSASTLAANAKANEIYVERKAANGGIAKADSPVTTALTASPAAPWELLPTVDRPVINGVDANQTATAARGGTLQLTVTVATANGATSGYTWTLTTATNADTYIDAGNLLHVSSTQNTGNLDIRAVNDSGVQSLRLRVTVTAAP